MNKIFIGIILIANIMLATPPVCSSQYDCEDYSQLSNLKIDRIKPYIEGSMNEILTKMSANIVSAATVTNDKSKVLSDNVNKTIKLMKKLYDQVDGKDISKSKRRVIETLTKIKQDANQIKTNIKGIRSSFEEARDLSIKSYVSIKKVLLDKRGAYNSTERRTDLQACSDAGNICNVTYEILEIYSSFWKELIKLENKVISNVSYLNSLNDSIELYIRDKCNKRGLRCIYPIGASMDVEVGGLQKVLLAYQEQLINLLTKSKEYREGK